MIPYAPLKEPIDEEIVKSTLKLCADTGFLNSDDISWIEQTITRPEVKYDGFAILHELFATAKAYMVESGKLFHCVKCRAELREYEALQPWEKHEFKRRIRQILYSRQNMAYKQRNVLIGIPQRIQHPKHLAPCLNSFNPGQHIHARVHPVYGLDYAEARNALVKTALSEDAITHILFVDDDILMPREGLSKLLEYHLPVVSGIYCKKNPSLETGVTAIGKDSEYVYSQQRVHYEHGNMEPIAVDCTGGGFILIDVEVFKKFDKDEKPYEFLMGDDGRVKVGEDSLFCQKLSMKGVPVAVVPGLAGLHVDFSAGGRGFDVSTWGPTELVDPFTRRIRKEFENDFVYFPDDADFDVKQLMAPDVIDFFGKNEYWKSKGLLK